MILLELLKIECSKANRSRLVSSSTLISLLPWFYPHPELGPIIISTSPWFHPDHNLICSNIFFRLYFSKFFWVFDTAMLIMSFTVTWNVQIFWWLNPDVSNLVILVWPEFVIRLTLAHIQTRLLLYGIVPPSFLLVMNDIHLLLICGVRDVFWRNCFNESHFSR